MATESAQNAASKTTGPQREAPGYSASLSGIFSQLEAVGSTLRDYTDRQHRTKLNQRKLFVCLLELAQQHVANSEAVPSRHGQSVTVTIGYRELHRLLGQKHLVTTADSNFPHFMSNQMPTIHAIVRRLDIACEARGLPLRITSIKHGHAFEMCFLIRPRSGMPSSIPDFADREYINRLLKHIDDLIRLDSLGAISLAKLCTPMVTPRSSGDAIHSTIPLDASLPVDDALLDESDKYLSVVGNPGSGMTTSIRYLASRLCERYLKDPGQAPLPIYLECKPHFFDSLAAAITTHSGIRLTDRQLLLDFMIPRLVCILVDGYDHLDDSERRAWFEEFQELKAHCPNCRFIMATPPAVTPTLDIGQHFYILMPLPDLREFLHMHGVTPSRADELVTRISKLQESEWLSSPKFLSLLALALVDNVDVAPLSDTPSPFLRELIETRVIPDALSRRQARTLCPSRLRHREITRALSALAYPMLAESPMLRHDQAVAALSQSLASTIPNEATSLSRSLLDASLAGDILRTTSTDTVTFSCPVLRDILAAMHMQSNPDTLMTKKALSTLMEWHRCDRTLSILVSDARTNIQDTMVTTALSLDVALAVRLFLSIPPTRRNPAIEKSLIETLMKMRSLAPATLQKALLLLCKMATRDSIAALVDIADEQLAIARNNAQNKYETFEDIALAFLAEDTVPPEFINVARLQKHVGASGENDPLLRRVIQRTLKIKTRLKPRVWQGKAIVPGFDRNSMTAINAKQQRHIVDVVSRWERYVSRIAHDAYQCTPTDIRPIAVDLEKLLTTALAIKGDGGTFFHGTLLWMETVLERSHQFMPHDDICRMIKDYHSCLALLHCQYFRSHEIDVLANIRTTHQRRYCGLIPPYCFHVNAGILSA